MYTSSAGMKALEADLLREASAGNKLRVGALLRQGVPVDCTQGLDATRRSHTGVPQGDMATALLLSAESGHVDVVKLLAARGANIHKRDSSGRTALLLGAVCDHLPVVLFLISIGADPTAEDKWKRSALTSYGTGKSPQEAPAVTLDAASLASRMAAIKAAREAYQTKMLHRPTQATAALLFSESFSDLLFVCVDGERIHAHRCMVAISSPHMRTMLMGPWAENTGPVSEVAMPQSAPAVRALLRFMYTGEVDAEACTAHTMDVLDLASQHEQPELKERCEAHIVDSVSAQNVLPILEAAHVHELKALTAECTNFVEKNIPKVDLISIVQFADKHGKADLKAACERGSLASINAGNAVALLDTALRLDLKSLKAACIDRIAQSTVLAVSPGFVELATTQPDLWTDLRVAAARHE